MRWCAKIDKYEVCLSLNVPAGDPTAASRWAVPLLLHHRPTHPRLLHPAAHRSGDNDGNHDDDDDDDGDDGDDGDDDDDGDGDENPVGVCPACSRRSVTVISVQFHEILL